MTHVIKALDALIDELAARGEPCPDDDVIATEEWVKRIIPESDIVAQRGWLTAPKPNPLIESSVVIGWHYGEFLDDFELRYRLPDGTRKRLELPTTR